MRVRSTAETAEMVRFMVGNLVCVCRPRLEAALRELLGRDAWVYDALRRQPGTRLLQGRRPVVAGEIGGVPAVVKRLHHGGALAPLTRDRFLTAARLRTHRRVATWLRSQGVPTPEVLFTAWRRQGLVVRGEIGTCRIIGARDASDTLFASADVLPEGWEAVVDAAAAMVAKLHLLGVIHHDLNLKNFLVTSGGEVMILDVDKASCTNLALGRRARRRNLARLERSVRKQGSGVRAENVERVLRRLHEAYGEARASL